MLITEHLDLNKSLELSPEEVAEIEEAAKHPVVYDKDCPPLSQETMEKYLRLGKKTAV